MTIEIISDVSFNDPSNLIPYLEKDEAIVRGVTKGMLDFSNTETYAGTDAIPVNTTMKSLTSDAGIATVGPTTPFAAIEGGMLPMPVAGIPYLTLPDTFKLPSTCKKFVAIVWAKLPAGAWPNPGSGGNLFSIFGHMSNSTNLAQWGIAAKNSASTGLPSDIIIYTPASSITAVGVAMSAPAALAAFDGNLHQFAIEWDGTTPGIVLRKAYIDRVPNVTSSPSGAWDNAIPTPAAAVRIGSCPAFQTVYPAGMFVGRPSLWDLTGSNLTTADVLQRDWDAAQGYLA